MLRTPAVIAVALAVSVGSGVAVAATGDRDLGRISGQDRYLTAVAISQEAFPGTAAVVYLARADGSADALAGSSLTANGPVLLVPQCGKVPAAVLEEADRLQPASIRALGGEGAVCDAVLAQFVGTAGDGQVETPVAQGPAGPTGPPGPAGRAGADGAPGVDGADGPAGVNEAAQFFALMPPDNAATVASGADVQFPQDGPNTGDGAAVRTGSSTFSLREIGVYRVSYQVPVTEAGQLVLTLDGADLAYTVAGRATGTVQITSTVLVETTTIGSVLTVRNPADSSTALTITPLAGGTRPVAASLLIERVA